MPTSLEELKSIIQSYSFKGSLSILEIQWFTIEPVETAPGDVRIQFEVLVVDRNQELSLDPTARHVWNTIPPILYISLAQSPVEVREAFETWLMKLWIHEFWEGLHYSGKRVREQH